MATTLSVTDARASLPRLIDRVQEGAEIVITRHGRPVAVVVRPDTLRVRRVDDVIEAAERLHEMLVVEPEPGLPAPAMTLERADELVAWIRAGRDAR